jgi:recombination protein RecA
MVEKTSAVVSRKGGAVGASSFLLSGSTLLDIALNDKTKFGGYQPGSVVNIAGASQAGKSILAMCIAAEAKHKHTGYKVIINETEFTRYFDLIKLFNLEEGDVEWTNTTTTEDFFVDVLRRAKKGEKFIYILDSIDGLSSKEEKNRIKQMVDGKEVDGSYNVERAKSMSQNLRHLAGELEKTQSIVVIISQLRQKIGVQFGEKLTTSIGTALYYWSTHQLWLTIADTITDKKLQTGVYIKCKIKKNKLTGKVRTVEFPIYYDYGVDDVGSMVDFLVEMKKCNGKKLFDIEARGVDDLIMKIEDNEKEEELRELVRAVWMEREEDVKLNRKPKYA